jgi:hypothetical protein
MFWSLQPFFLEHDYSNEQLVSTYTAHLVWLNMHNDKRSNTPVTSDTNPRRITVKFSVVMSPERIRIRTQSLKAQQQSQSQQSQSEQSQAE